MRLLILINAALMLAGTLHAQSYTSASFTNATYPSVTMGSVNYVDLSGQTGIGQTWDVTTADAPDQFQFGIIPVEEGAGNEAFPNANFAMEAFADDISSTLYFDLTSTELQEVGFFAGEPGTGVAQVYSDYKEYFTFPVSMGSSGTDSFSGTLEFEDGFAQQIEGEITYEVVGAGTVITNAGIYDNALLVLSTETVVSTIDIGGMELETTSVSEAYDILIEGFPVAVASMESTTTTSQGGTETSEQGTVLTAAETFTEELHKVKASIYPNPAFDQLSIACKDCIYPIELTVTSLSGRIVMSEQILGAQTTLDVHHLSPGLYVVEGRSNASVFRQKLVIE